MSLFEAPGAKTLSKVLLFRAILCAMGRLYSVIHIWLLKLAQTSKTGCPGRHCDLEQQMSCLNNVFVYGLRKKFVLEAPVLLLCGGATTRTTRTPAFWGYPPPPHDYPHYWIPSQKNNRSRTENVTEQTWFSKSRSNDLEDIGQGQRSSHATHLLMLVIICTKYGKNPSRTVDATERTRFSRSTPNDLEDIGQGQRSSHATHLLMLVIICTKYGKNPSRTVDATERTRFSRSRPNDLEDIGQGQRSSCATHLLILVIICTIYGKNPSRTVDATERTRFSRSRPSDLEDIGQGQRSLYATHPLMLVIICAKYGKNPSRIVDFFFQGQGQKV